MINNKIKETLIILACIFYLTIFCSFILSLPQHKTYNKETIEIAKVLCAEACGEGKIGMIGVANTIANRAKKWHKTPYQIITQKNQYYGYTAKNKNLLYHQCKHIALPLAKNILTLKDITNGALYFRRKNEPIYSWHKIKTIIIKHHIFYK